MKRYGSRRFFGVMALVLVLKGGLLVSARANDIEIQPLESLGLRDRPYLQIVPTPMQAEYANKVAKIGRVAIETGSPALQRLIERSFSEIPGKAGGEGPSLRIVCKINDNEANPEAYTLVVKPEGKDIEARITASRENGLAFGVESLRQLVLERKGATWVRLARVEDHPSVAFRAVKRASDHWFSVAHRYKLNGATLTSPLQPDGKMAYDEDVIAKSVGRAREHFLELLVMVSMGNIYRGSESYKNTVVEAFAGLARQGVARISLMNDDKMTLLDAEGYQRYASYFEAQMAYLSAINEKIREVSPTTSVGFMPNSYYGREFEEYFAGEYKDKLPKDVALMWCGPSTPGPDQKLSELKKVAAQVGANSLWIYTNWPQCGNPYWCENLGPIRNHEFDDNKLIKLVTISTQSVPEPLPVSLITLCDQLWNPTAYDPERSLRLAVKEVVDPESYEAFLALTQYIDRNVGIANVSTFRPMYGADTPEGRREVILRREAELTPLVQACLDTPAGKTEGPIRKLLESMLGNREKYLTLLAEDEAIENKDISQVKTISCPLTTATPKLDGNLDDAAWKNAALASEFTDIKGERRAPQQTLVKMLRTEDAIFLGIRCEQVSGDGNGLETGFVYPLSFRRQKAGFLWWGDAMEIFFDPNRDRKKITQIIVNPYGLMECFSYDLPNFGHFGRKNLKREDLPVEGVVNKQGDLIEYELKIPLSIFDGPPGGIWGFSVGRTLMSKNKDVVKYSTWTPLGWGFQNAANFGKLTFQ